MKSTTSILVLCALAAPAQLQAQCSASKATAGSAARPVSYAEEAKDIVSTAVAAGSFKTLAAALEAGDLIPALQGKGPFTVFAPTDEAFAKLPKGTLEHLLKPENKGLLTSILTYHVVPANLPASTVVKTPFAASLNGQRLNIEVSKKGVSVAGAKVVTTDIQCSNGVIHVIDQVMLPSSKDIVETAAGNDAFETLVTALKAAMLVEALQADGPFTVFAPTDEAFAKLPAETLQSLLQPENREQLQSILLYHVVPGRVYSDQAIKADSASTLQGSSLSLRYRDGRLWVDQSTVINADLETSNGVIHVIDTVLLPN
ncbi:MAG: fasciclin domain-containing protein [Planctomycetota bacterium]|nr:MAG: fasciclin domain-containing protein [Planctomycetota bacterium]